MVINKILALFLMVLLMDLLVHNYLHDQINLNNNKKETNSKNGMNREISLMKEKITKMNEEYHNEKRESELMRKRVLQENIQSHNQKLLKENVRSVLI
jgi:hypothetical protein